jgi:hypothetical protein
MGLGRGRVVMVRRSFGLDWTGVVWMVQCGVGFEALSVVVC